MTEPQFPNSAISMRLREGGIRIPVSSYKQHATVAHPFAPDQVAAVVQFMESMLDPIADQLATAPVEDEGNVWVMKETRPLTADQFLR